MPSIQFFSIVETAKASGLNPQKYLEYLLEPRLSEKLKDEDLAKHAPWCLLHNKSTLFSKKGLQKTPHGIRRLRKSVNKK